MELETVIEAEVEVVVVVVETRLACCPDEDADEAWLAVENPADARCCYAGVAPGGRDRDAHLFLGGVAAGAAVEAVTLVMVLPGNSRFGRQVIVSRGEFRHHCAPGFGEADGRCEGL